MAEWDFGNWGSVCKECERYQKEIKLLKAKQEKVQELLTEKDQVLNDVKNFRQLIVNADGVYRSLSKEKAAKDRIKDRNGLYQDRQRLILSVVRRLTVLIFSSLHYMKLWEDEHKIARRAIDLSVEQRLQLSEQDVKLLSNEQLLKQYMALVAEQAEKLKAMDDLKKEIASLKNELRKQSRQHKKTLERAASAFLEILSQYHRKRKLTTKQVSWLEVCEKGVTGKKIQDSVRYTPIFKTDALTKNASDSDEDGHNVKGAQEDTLRDVAVGASDYALSCDACVDTTDLCVEGGGTEHSVGIVTSGADDGCCEKSPDSGIQIPQSPLSQESECSNSSIESCRNLRHPAVVPPSPVLEDGYLSDPPRTPCNDWSIVDHDYFIRPNDNQKLHKEECCSELTNSHCAKPSKDVPVRTLTPEAVEETFMDISAVENLPVDKQLEKLFNGVSGTLEETIPVRPKVKISEENVTNLDVHQTRAYGDQMTQLCDQNTGSSKGFGSCAVRQTESPANQKINVGEQKTMSLEAQIFGDSDDDDEEDDDYLMTGLKKQPVNLKEKSGGICKQVETRDIVKGSGRELCSSSVTQMMSKDDHISPSGENLSILVKSSPDCHGAVEEPLGKSTEGVLTKGVSVDKQQVSVEQDLFGDTDEDDCWEEVESPPEPVIHNAERDCAGEKEELVFGKGIVDHSVKIVDAHVENGMAEFKGGAYAVCVDNSSVGVAKQVECNVLECEDNQTGGLSTRTEDGKLGGEGIRDKCSRGADESSGDISIENKQRKLVNGSEDILMVEQQITTVKRDLEKDTCRYGQQQVNVVKLCNGVHETVVEDKDTSLSNQLRGECAHIEDGQKDGENTFVVADNWQQQQGDRESPDITRMLAEMKEVEHFFVLSPMSPDEVQGNDDGDHIGLEESSLLDCASKIPTISQIDAQENGNKSHLNRGSNLVGSELETGAANAKTVDEESINAKNRFEDDYVNLNTVASTKTVNEVKESINSKNRCEGDSVNLTNTAENTKTVGQEFINDKNQFEDGDINLNTSAVIKTLCEKSINAKNQYEDDTVNLTSTAANTKTVDEESINAKNQYEDGEDFISVKDQFEGHHTGLINTRENKTGLATSSEIFEVGSKSFQNLKHEHKMMVNEENNAISITSQLKDFIESCFSEVMEKSVQKQEFEEFISKEFVPFKKLITDTLETIKMGITMYHLESSQKPPCGTPIRNQSSEFNSQRKTSPLPDLPQKTSEMLETVFTEQSTSASGLAVVRTPTTSQVVADEVGSPILCEVSDLCFGETRCITSHRKCKRRRVLSSSDSSDQEYNLKHLCQTSTCKVSLENILSKSDDKSKIISTGTDEEITEGKISCSKNECMEGDDTRNLNRKNDQQSFAADLSSDERREVKVKNSRIVKGRKQNMVMMKSNKQYGKHAKEKQNQPAHKNQRKNSLPYRRKEVESDTLKASQRALRKQINTMNSNKDTVSDKCDILSINNENQLKEIVEESAHVLEKIDGTVLKNESKVSFDYVIPNAKPSRIAHKSSKDDFNQLSLHDDLDLKIKREYFSELLKTNTNVKSSCKIKRPSLRKRIISKCERKSKIKMEENKEITATNLSHRHKGIRSKGKNSTACNNNTGGSSIHFVPENQGQGLLSQENGSFSIYNTDTNTHTHSDTEHIQEVLHSSRLEFSTSDNFDRCRTPLLTEYYKEMSRKADFPVCSKTDSKTFNDEFLLGKCGSCNCHDSFDCKSCAEQCDTKLPRVKQEPSVCDDNIDGCKTPPLSEYYKTVLSNSPGRDHTTGNANTAVGSLLMNCSAVAKSIDCLTGASPVVCPKSPINLKSKNSPILNSQIDSNSVGLQRFSSSVTAEEGVTFANHFNGRDSPAYSSLNANLAYSRIQVKSENIKKEYDPDLECNQPTDSNPSVDDMIFNVVTPVNCYTWNRKQVLQPVKEEFDLVQSFKGELEKDIKKMDIVNTDESNIQDIYVEAVAADSDSSTCGNDQKEVKNDDVSVGLHLNVRKVCVGSDISPAGLALSYPEHLSRSRLSGSRHCAAMVVSKPLNSSLIVKPSKPAVLTCSRQFRAAVELPNTLHSSVTELCNTLQDDTPCEETDAVKAATKMPKMQHYAAASKEHTPLPSLVAQEPNMLQRAPSEETKTFHNPSVGASQMLKNTSVEKPKTLHNTYAELPRLNHYAVRGKEHTSYFNSAAEIPKTLCGPYNIDQKKLYNPFAEVPKVIWSMSTEEYKTLNNRTVVKSEVLGHAIGREPKTLENIAVEVAKVVNCPLATPKMEPGTPLATPKVEPGTPLATPKVEPGMSGTILESSSTIDNVSKNPVGYQNNKETSQQLSFQDCWQGYFTRCQRRLHSDRGFSKPKFDDMESYADNILTTFLSKEVTQSSVDATVYGLTNYSRGMTSMILAICIVRAVMNNISEQYVQVRQGMLNLTDTEHHLLALVFKLNYIARFRCVKDQILSNISFGMFRLNRTPPADVLYALSRFFVLISLRYELYTHILMMCCDALFALSYGAFPVIYAAFMLYDKTLLPANVGKEHPLSLVISHVILSKQNTNGSPLFRVEKLKNLVCRKYGYQRGEFMFRDVLKKLTDWLREGRLSYIERAFLILAKKEPWHLIYKEMIQKQLMVMLAEWQDKKLSYPVILVVIRLLGYLPRSFPHGPKTFGAVTEILETLGGLLGKPENTAEFEETVVTATMSLANHCFKQVFTIVSSWKPLRPVPDTFFDVLYSARNFKEWPQLLNREKCSD